MRVAEAYSSHVCHKPWRCGKGCLRQSGRYEQSRNDRGAARVRIRLRDGVKIDDCVLVRLEAEG